MLGFVELALMLPAGRSPSGQPCGCLSRSARFPLSGRPLGLAVFSAAEELTKNTVAIENVIRRYKVRRDVFIVKLCMIIISHAGSPPSMAGNENSDRGLEGLFFDEVAVLIPCQFQKWLAFLETSFCPH